MYSIELQCPSCRGGFNVTLSHILALRDGELQDMLREVPDVELNARDLRRKHDISDDKLMLLSEAKKCYQTVVRDQKLVQKQKKKGASKSIKKKGSRDQPDGEEEGEPVLSDGEAKVETQKSSDTHDSTLSSNDPNAKRMKDKIEYVDNMLFRGLGDSMSDAERNFVLQLMTSGSIEKIVFAAQLFQKILAMNAIPKDPSEPQQVQRQRNRQERPTSAISSSSGNISALTTSTGLDNTDLDSPSVSMQASRSADEADTYTAHYRTRRQRPPVNAFSASAAAFPTVAEHSQTKFELEAAQRREWSAMYPLPFRMPLAFLLPLDFDPYDRKNSPIRFLDDEVTIPFSHDQKYSELSYEDRCNVVKDAFSNLHVSIWQKVFKRDNSNFLGADNILSGLEPDADERQAPDEKIPWRRVVVSFVNRTLSRTVGLKVGDVVTHLDGEPFDGNVEKLKFVLDAKRNEQTVGDEIPSVEIVVNAEASVAEAIRLRSFMVRNQPYD